MREQRTLGSVPIGGPIAKVSASQKEEDSDIVILARNLIPTTPEHRKGYRGSRIRWPKKFFSPSASETHKMP